ncbi:MAG: hypothetical protein FVQ81_07005 [Candidatus Glassbacteria bacterium]|nr:hypothetical protein [Candidatus Glassbacteria bacterium]
MDFSRAKFSVLAACLILIVGCSARSTYYIELQLSDQNASQNVDVEFLSYDYPAVLDSLVQMNKPGPRPDSSELLALLSTYQQILERSARMADSVDVMRDELENMSNKSVAYRKKYPIFQKLESGMQDMLDERHEVHQRYLDLKGQYEAKLNDWKGRAYKGFGEFKEAISPELATKIEVTDKNSRINNLILPFGIWWLHCEVRRPGTTNESLIWDMPLPTDQDSVQLNLNEDNARIQQELL